MTHQTASDMQQHIKEKLAATVYDRMPGPTTEEAYTQFADEVGLNRIYASNRLSGRVHMSLYDFLLFSTALNINPSAFCNWGGSVQAVPA